MVGTSAIALFVPMNCVRKSTPLSSDGVPLRPLLRNSDWQTGPASIAMLTRLDSSRSGRRTSGPALERIIEKAGEVDVTASAVVAAVQAYAKINSAGEWIDRSETVSMNQLFDRMSATELEAYAQTGALPGWFKATVGATDDDSRKRLTLDI